MKIQDVGKKKFKSTINYNSVENSRPLVGEKKYRSYSFEDITKIENCIIYGDSSDCLIIIAENENALKLELKKYLDGDTMCDFATQIFFIIKNGELVKTSDFIS